jgi:hypothetical protein
MYLNDYRREGPIYIAMNQQVQKFIRDECVRKLPKPASVSIKYFFHTLNFTFQHLAVDSNPMSFIFWNKHILLYANNHEQQLRQSTQTHLASTCFIMPETGSSITRTACIH